MTVASAWLCAGIQADANVVIQAITDSGHVATLTEGSGMTVPPEPIDMLLSTKEVLFRLGIGRTTLWQMEKRGDFPKAIVLNVRCKRWRSCDIEDYINGLSPALSG